MAPRQDGEAGHALEGWLNVVVGGKGEHPGILAAGVVGFVPQSLENGGR